MKAPTIRMQDPIPKDKIASQFLSQRPREYRDNTHSRANANQIRSVAWNALGNRIAVTFALSSLIRVWIPDKFEVRYSTELKGHSASVDSVAWDPNFADGLASCCAIDGSVRLWNARTKNMLQVVRTGTEVNFLTYSPDGKYLAVCTNSRRMLILENGSLSQKEPYVDIESDVSRAIFSFSGDILFIALKSGSVRVVSFDSGSGSAGSILMSFAAHMAPITCMELDPKGRYLALGSNDSLVSLWDLQEWVCVRTLGKAGHSIRSLSFSFDGSYLAISADKDEPVQIAHVESGEYLGTVNRPSPFTVPMVSWHPTKYLLAYGGDNAGLKVLGSDDGK
ncbi:WD40-repeat-containing domain protein [Dipodascopsis uninucleata]